MPRKASTQIDPHAATVPPESGEVASAELAPGRILADKYAIEHVIGEGGLGIVLKARHQQLDQNVAIKHLKPEAAARPDIVERFLREARLAAKIKNEHAVKVHDVDTVASGVPYMVMEYLEGRDLDQAIAESPLPVQVAIDYVMQAIEALAEAHAAGIVHRDLKPANLFLASRPGSTSIVKVLDFGISKLTSGDAESRKRRTRIDESVGTPAYMSPEQLQAAQDVDQRSDVWSLGVVLHELVSGTLPFDGPDVPQVCAAVLTKPPVPLSAVHDDAPPELEQVITRCLQKDRTKRYQNVAELAQDLMQIWEGETPSRVQHINQIISGTGQKIAAPTPFPGSIDTAAVRAAVASATGSKPQVAPGEPTAVIDADTSAWADEAASVEEDLVLAVFSDESGAAVDELEFLSIDEAYDYATTLPSRVTRCELYDHLAGVRGKLRATYVRRAETGHWVPLLE
ncbi:MAG TPA: serine/threonine-protein kinase [Polyangiaceae bacterium]